MDFIKNITSTVNETTQYMIERSKRNVAIGKLTNDIKLEKGIAEKDYMALGKYFYNVLRDKGNEETEPTCLAIDECENRIQGLLTELREIYKENEEKKEDVACEETVCEQEQSEYEETPQQNPEMPMSEEELPFE